MLLKVNQLKKRNHTGAVSWVNWPNRLGRRYFVEGTTKLNDGQVARKSLTTAIGVRVFSKSYST